MILLLKGSFYHKGEIMVKLYSVFAVVVCSMSVTMSCWAGNACTPIALACMAEGYYKGGDSVGKGLVKNCVMPVVFNKKLLLNDSFSSADLKSCKSVLGNENSIPL